MVNVAPPEVFTPPLMLPPLDISLLPEDSKSAAKAVRARLSSCIGLASHGASPGINATLHSCKALVEYRPEDEYCEDKMRPYPLDRLLAVRAGMGTGVFCLGGHPGVVWGACHTTVRCALRGHCSDRTFIG